MSTKQHIKTTDSDDEYEVEAILDSRYNKRTNNIEYLLKWKGYNEKTWEKEEDLHCEDLLKKFHAQRPKKLLKSKSPSRNTPASKSRRREVTRIKLFESPEAKDNSATKIVKVDSINNNQFNKDNISELPKKIESIERRYKAPIKENVGDKRKFIENVVWVVVSAFIIVYGAFFLRWLFS